MKNFLLRSTLLIQYMQPGKQQIKGFDKNKEIPIDETQNIYQKLLLSQLLNTAL